MIDEADARHAVQSANARWSNTVAILTGDYLFAKASEISTELGTDICALLARTIATLCDGQIREVEAAGRIEQSETDYLDIIRRKTGALIATSCRLGGMLSDAPPDALDVLEQYGKRSASRSSSPTTSWTSRPASRPWARSRDREGVYTLPGPARARRIAGSELRAILQDGPPSGDRLDRALEIVRVPDHLGRARAAVVSRSTVLTR